MTLMLSEHPSCGTPEEHRKSCDMCIEQFQIFDDLKNEMDNCESIDDKERHIKKIEQYQQNLQTYIFHLVRGKYQRKKFEEDINSITDRSCVVVADYMMKLLFQKLFEPQKDWFGKKGVSLHGTMFLFKSEGKLMTEFHDLYCEDDDKQNWFFSASCLEESLKNFKSLHPGIDSAKLWTDNGPHYKNTSFAFWLPKLKEATRIKIMDFRNFEPQTGKTKLDSHYATLKFSLKQFRHEGNDVVSGEDIEKGTFKRLRGTHLYGVHIDRNEEPESAKTLKGISEYSDVHYSYNESEEYEKINCSFQIGLELHKEINSGTISKHWNERSKNVSLTGVKSNFDIHRELQVAELPQKQRKEKEEKQSKSNEKHKSSPGRVNIDVNLPKCPDCGKIFLREQNLTLHENSKACWQNKPDSKKRKYPEKLIGTEGTLKSSVEK